MQVTAFLLAVRFVSLLPASSPETLVLQSLVFTLCFMVVYMCPTRVLRVAAGVPDVALAAVGWAVRRPEYPTYVIRPRDSV